MESKSEMNLPYLCFIINKPLCYRVFKIKSYRVQLNFPKICHMSKIFTFKSFLVWDIATTASPTFAPVFPSLSPTVIPTLQPTRPPSGDPTPNPTPSPVRDYVYTIPSICADLDWVDSEGDACSTYANLCTEGVPNFHSGMYDNYENNNLTALEACCACGGGYDLTESPTFQPTERPTQLPTIEPTEIPTFSPTDPTPIPTRWHDCVFVMNLTSTMQL